MATPQTGHWTMVADTGEIRRVSHDALRATVAKIFASTGMGEADADLLSGTLVASDLRGVPSHGVIHVPGYVGRLTEGGVDPRGRPKVVRRTGGAIRVDGGNSMGQIGARFAMETAIDAAAANGIAMATVGNSNHCGALAYFVELAVAKDMIGIACTNAIPTMAPWGGRDRILGINPIAVGIPAGELPAFVLDMSFSAVSRGKIVVHHQAGRELEDGWALDRSGRPTRNPERALEGLLLPIGGYKGTGLAMVSGILSTLLSGAVFGTGVGSLEDGAVAGADGHALIAVNVAAFEDPDVFHAGIAEVLETIRGSAPLDDAIPVAYPGERAGERVAEGMEKGVPVAARTLLSIAQTCSARGIDPSPLGL